MNVLYSQRSFVFSLDTTYISKKVPAGFQWHWTKCIVFLRFPGMDTGVKYDGWNAICLSGPSRGYCGALGRNEGQHITSKANCAGQELGWQCGGERRAQKDCMVFWSSDHITDKAGGKKVAKKDYLWVAQCVWHQACWVKWSSAVYCRGSSSFLGFTVPGASQTKP